MQSTAPSPPSRTSRSIGLTSTLGAEAAVHERIAAAVSSAPSQ